jgi:hypothetical protein
LILILIRELFFFFYNSGDFKHWLEFLLSGTRDETGQMYNVDIDVEALYKAGEKRVGFLDACAFFLFFLSLYVCVEV